MKSNKLEMKQRKLNIGLKKKIKKNYKKLTEIS